MATGIDIRGLSKRYHGTEVYALKDLTLQVEEGEVYGFLGPNGAGKSTTIRTLMNFIQPTAGQASILNLDIVKDSVELKKYVGYLPSDSGLYLKMTGNQFLDYMEELNPAVSRAHRNELVERLKADPSKKLGELSRGNRQKFAIIQAFMHQPKIMILDEPTSGLDPLMQEVFYQLVLEAKQRGATVFTSSHIMSEVQKICDRVGIIRAGELVGERTIAEMIKEAAQTFDITFTGKPPVAALEKLPDVEVKSHHDHSVTLHARGKLQPLLKELAKHEVVSLDARQLDLEEVFMHYYQDPGDAA